MDQCSHIHYQKPVLLEEKLKSDQEIGGKSKKVVSKCKHEYFSPDLLLSDFSDPI